MYSFIVYIILNPKKINLISGRISSPFENKITFFGYYDKYVDNSEGLLAFHSCDKTNKQFRHGHIVNLAVTSNDFSDILWQTESNCFNWQQGTRLQWVNDSNIIYNDFSYKTNSFVANYINVYDNEKINQFKFPVQDSCEQYFLSINYSRLFTLRKEYGYHNLGKLSRKSLNDYENDGIFYIDVTNGKSSLIVRLSELINDLSENNPTRYFHKVNHISISPNCDKFIFLHRYIKNNKRIDRLFLYTLSTNKLQLLLDSSIISHYCWINNYQILGFLKPDQSAIGYYIYDINLKDFKSFMPFQNFPDGHPSFRNDYIITDTYPDRNRLQHIHLHNLKSGETSCVTSCYHGFKHISSNRCDLHPHLSRCNKYIYYDSIQNGYRQFTKYKL